MPPARATAPATARSGHSGPDGLGFLPVRALCAGFAAGTFTPLDVLEEVLGRARGVARDLGAISFLDEGGAVEQARASTLRWRQGHQLGPFDGVPVTVKDSLAVRGLPSVRGSLLRRDAPPEDTEEPAVARLREAGAVIVAKTTMPEFAWSAVSDSPVWGVVRNAWDPTRTAGGSSGGAAVATALGVGTVGLGSDGAGSVRIPASFNGVVGLKATYGRIPATPSGAFGRLAHIGPLTRTVEDAALTLDVLARPDPRDPDALDAPRISYAQVVDRAEAFTQQIPPWGITWMHEHQRRARSPAPRRTGPTARPHPARRSCRARHVRDGHGHHGLNARDGLDARDGPRHGAHGPRRARRPCRPLPPPVLDDARGLRPSGRLQPDVRPPRRLRPPRGHMGPVGLPSAGHRRLPLGWLAVPDRGRLRDPLAQAGDDAAHRPGHHRRLPRVVGGEPAPAGPLPGVLVGAGPAGGHHAAGPLGRDALPGPDLHSLGLLGRPPAR
ncbi:Amidase [Propionibacterium freudenreichii]|nr:Amidase [Propionibacterium freudenreichii]